MTQEMRIIGVSGLPEIAEGDDLAALIFEAALGQSTPLEAGDVVVVTQKIVSKAEGAIVDLRDVTPSPLAEEFARQFDKDPRHVEVVLRETKRVVRMERGVLIVETKHGFVCANAGVDASNVPGDERLSLLPKNPDESARAYQKRPDGARRLSGGRDHIRYLRQTLEDGNDRRCNRHCRYASIKGLPRRGRPLRLPLASERVRRRRRDSLGGGAGCGQAEHGARSHSQGLRLPAR